MKKTSRWQLKESDFKLIENGKFNAEYPPNYNLLLGRVEETKRRPLTNLLPSYTINLK